MNEIQIAARLAQGILAITISFSILFAIGFMLQLGQTI